MGKKKTIQEAPEESVGTGVAILQPINEKPKFIDLIKFKDKDASLKIIKDKRAEYDKVKIDGVDDTANYKIVVANMSQMRDDRRAFEDAAYLNVIDPLKAALKDYVADIDAVVNEFKAGEKAERDKKDFIDDEKKRIKKEKEEAKVKAALARATDLFILGAKFDGQVYSFDYDQMLLINTLQLQDFDDAEFGEFLEEVKTAWGVEQTHLEEERAEAVRQEQLLVDEAQQVADDKVKNQQEAKVLTEKRTKLRIKELTMMGFVLDDTAEDPHTYFNVNCGHYDLNSIEIDTDEGWDETIASLELSISMGRSGSVDIPVVSDASTMAANESFHTRAGFGATVDPQLEAAVDEPEVATELRDYSLNDFENLTRAAYNGTTKQKQVILEAISSYKEACDKF